MNEKDFIQEMHRRFNLCTSAELKNLEAAREDIEFTYGKQWEDAVEKARKDKGKPVLTINRLPAYVAQVVNNRLMNETMIRVLPENSGTKEVAEIREGLIRSIFKNSDADFARDEACKYQVICGVGYFYLDFDYESDDVFEQEIKVKHVPNPFSAVLDPASTIPDGSDANYGFVIDTMSKEEFKSRYPKKDSSISFDPIINSVHPSEVTSWFDEDQIRVVLYWQMVTEGTKILALLQNGNTVRFADTDELEARLPEVQLDSTGKPVVREVPNKFARLTVCSGKEILEEARDYPISSIPIFRVTGWEMRTDKAYNRFGLIRFLKDPARFHNFWRSTVAEQLVNTPRNKFIATASAVKGREDAWRKAAKSDDPLMIHNDDAPEPRRLEPPQMDAALLNEASIAAQDIKDISNIHEAALGQQSNEVSGKAILARQNVSDVSVYIFQDRLKMAEERCGKVINELIPIIYDTTRMVKVIGRDDKDDLVLINDPNSELNDVTSGKYGVLVTTAPATATKRAQTAEQIQAFINAAPDQAKFFMDIFAEALDWNKSEEFVKRWRMMAPEGLVPDDELPPEVLMKRQQAAQEQQRQQMLLEAKAQLDAERVVSQSDADRARAAMNMATMQKTVYEMAQMLQTMQSQMAGIVVPPMSPIPPPPAHTPVGQDTMGAVQALQNDINPQQPPEQGLPNG